MTVTFLFCVHRTARDTERNKEIGFLEAQLYEYVEVLSVSMIVLPNNFPTFVITTVADDKLVSIDFCRSRGNLLMRMCRGSKLGLERNVRKRRRNSSVRVKAKTKTTKSSTTPKICHWVGMARYTKKKTGVERKLSVWLRLGGFFWLEPQHSIQWSAVFWWLVCGTGWALVVLR